MINNTQQSAKGTMSLSHKIINKVRNETIGFLKNLLWYPLPFHTDFFFEPYGSDSYGNFTVDLKHASETTIAFINDCQLDDFPLHVGDSYIQIHLHQGMKGLLKKIPTLKKTYSSMHYMIGCSNFLISPDNLDRLGLSMYTLPEHLSKKTMPYINQHGGTLQKLLFPSAKVFQKKGDNIYLYYAKISDLRMPFDMD